ncbi:ABC transporter substrate-binding protein [Nonomuraea sp. MG754425]|uniref:ABC transporter substrate-binding protein n=1 Tax=Nonomuraea sp. MG754425 TaxID=2570319 RepID=UPI001F1FBBEF|nr:ABC transporter substrate-binding protein [Nonomuraea sp. MG754425]MCF6468684.1 ABC transporter substrate-binding protein [Nonomuraea sp. MG754425]
MNGGARRVVSRRAALRGLAGAAGLAALSGCRVVEGGPPPNTQGLSKKPAPGRRVNITFYSLFGGVDGQGWVELARRFESVQDEIGVEVVYAPPTGQGEQQKLLVSIAAGDPPDLAMVIPFQVPQWAELGIMTDLTDLVRGAGLAERDFLPAVWQGMRWKERVWQLQWDVDPNFPFYWNKALFEECGLDPERPPRTVTEIDEFSRHITQVGRSGASRVGLVPWQVAGFANAAFTWGFAFGGSFVDPPTGQVTPDDERVVAAVDWMAGYARSLGGADRLNVAPPTLQMNPFGYGHMGMAPLGPRSVKQILEARPDFDYGATLLPYEPPGASEPGAGTWIGGWGAFIPSEARHPEAAWEFLRWFAATPEGTLAEFETVNYPPGYLGSPALERMKADRMLKPSYDAMFAATNIKPSLPATNYFSQQLEIHVARAIYGEVTAAEALRVVKENTRREAERFRNQLGL